MSHLVEALNVLTAQFLNFSGTKKLNQPATSNQQLLTPLESWDPSWLKIIRLLSKSLGACILYFGAVGRGKVSRGEGQVTRDKSEGFRFQAETVHCLLLTAHMASL
ncbi:MAG: hypothetical protein WCH75_31865, partial [Candidatus Binatia bacterium]